MPSRCCVTGCRGNYDATHDQALEKVSVFRFPTDQARRELWLRKIPREGLVVSKRTVVCERHFAPHFIVRVDSVTREDGTVLTVQRDIPKLTDDAYPSYFPNTPSYLTSDPPTQRKAPDTRRAEMISRDEDLFQGWLDSDLIETFEVVKAEIGDYILSSGYDWNVVNTTDLVCLYKLDLTDVAKIAVSISVNSELHVSVCKKGLRLDNAMLQWALGETSMLKHWSQLDTLLSHYGSETYEFSVNECVCNLEYCLSDLYIRMQRDECSEQRLERFKFLMEQFRLLFASQCRYSSETITFAFHMMCISRPAYEMLRERVLVLPHLSYLKRLSAAFTTNDGSGQDCEAHTVYLRNKATLLPLHERHVILLLDEIHVNQKTAYRGGVVCGMAVNSVEATASTVQSFMICSLLSSNKDVAAMLPVKNLNAAYLKECILKVIAMLENAGYFVFCVISDNNRVNRNAFTAICQGKLEPCIAHPNAAERKLFFLFDTVHLLKCIRNNWLGQLNNSHTFVCPGIVSHANMFAKFDDIRDLYHSERNSVIKLAPSLTYKALYPNSIERQNVQLALKIFDEKTAVALIEYGNQNKICTSDAHVFICLVIKLWRILNIKSVDKGVRKRDSDSEPIRADDDDRLVFLNDFYIWLVQWESFGLQPRDGCLTSETMFALKHTVKTFVVLIKYLLNDLHLSYVLTGKFQTDCLEARFGMYRRMSGTNYHVSVSQLYESEKKLKVLGMLNLLSKLTISIRDFISTCAEVNDSGSGDAAMPVECINAAGLADVVCECDLNVTVSESECKSLIFIAGYVAHKLLLHITCQLCKNELVTEHELTVEIEDEQFDYLRGLDRGGLKWPTELLVEVVTQVFYVFNCLISSKYESKFLSLTSHKSVVMKLALDRLELLDLLPGECVCGSLVCKVFEPAVLTIVHILLNNYCKRRTDLAAVQNAAKTKRKLSTLCK